MAKQVLNQNDMFIHILFDVRRENAFPNVVNKNSFILNKERIISV